MVPGQLRAKVILGRLGWVRRMIAKIRSLPLDSLADFTENPHVPASAEPYLRRCLEALFDLARHLLAKGFGRAASEYKAIARGLQEAGVLEPAEASLLQEMAGYRNRMVHFYDEVSAEELYQICTQGLTDIERVTKVFEEWMRAHPERMDEAL